MWRPKGHLDQSNPLGRLLPSSCLFSLTTGLFSWCRVFLGSRRHPAGDAFSFQLCSRQLWKKTARIPHGRRRKWWGYFGLSRCTGQHQPPCQGWAELLGAKLGVNCRSWQGILGLTWRAITALLFDSRHRHKPDQLESDSKTCIDTRKRGHNTGDKGQRPSQTSREAWFYRVAAVPILPLQVSYTDVSQRCWSPSLLLHQWCPARQGWLKGSHMCETLLTGKKRDSTCFYQCTLRRKAAW